MIDKPVAQVPVHPTHGRLWANVRPMGAETPLPSYPLDDLYDRPQGTRRIKELEIMCADLAGALEQAVAWDDGQRTAVHKLTHARAYLSNWRTMKDAEK